MEKTWPPPFYVIMERVKTVVLLKSVSVILGGYKQSGKWEMKSIVRKLKTFPIAMSGGVENRTVVGKTWKYFFLFR